MTGKRILERMLTMMMLLLLLSGASWAQSRAPQGSTGTAFTYQGYLTDTGGPVNATCDFTFGLYSAANDGTLLGTETADDLDVKEGLFTVQLNFGPGAFDGEARWLEITVDCGAGPAVLGPRQELTPTPYALYAAAAPWSGLDGVPPGFADSVDDDTTYRAGRGLTLSDTTFHVAKAYRLPRACGNGQIAEWDGSAWTCGDDDVGAGGACWKLTGNAGTTPGTNYLGTTDDQALDLHANGQRALRLESHADSPNLIGGYRDNEVAAGVVGATIGGGGASGMTNRVTDNYGAVGGGSNNLVGNGDGDGTNRPYGTVGGGYANTAMSDYSTVGGGQDNTASGYNASIGGGHNNTASGINATVSGGANNTASGQYSATVGGGDGNSASGETATVGGGDSNEASGLHAVIGGGAGNIADGYIATVAGGGENQASYIGTVSGGAWNVATGQRATVGGGESNTADGFHATIGGGMANEAGGNGATIAGGSYNVAEAQHATIAGGGPSEPDRSPETTNNRVTDDYGTIGGGGNNQTGNGDGYSTNRPYGTVGGGCANTAMSEFSTVGGGQDNTANGNTATIGGGGNNTASGVNSTVSGGANNTASGQHSATVGGGDRNSASGRGATVSGGEDNSASGQFATVSGGTRAHASHYGQMAYASGQFGDPGDAQASLYVLRNATNDDIPTELFLNDPWGTLPPERLTVAEGRTLTFDILVVARSDGGASAGYTVQGVIENVGGTTGFIGTPTMVELGKDADWTVAIQDDDPNGALSIQVTGSADTDIRWVATVRTSEVAWPVP